MVDIATEHETVKNIKLLVVGEMGSGKTSILRRYTKDQFSQYYKTTIGVDFASKDLEYKGSKVNVTLWDISGQERYGKMTRVYYTSAVGAFVVFDVTRPPSFEMVKTWIDDIKEKVFDSNGNMIPCVLLGNKIDLAAEKGYFDSKDKENEYIKENGFIKYFETSAFDGTNINEAVSYIVNHIMDNDIQPANKDDSRSVRLSHNEGKENGSSCC